MVTKTLEMFFKLERELCDVRKLETLRRVEIVDDVIRLIEMGRARMHLMQLDTGQVCQPHQRRILAGDDIIFFFFAKRNVLEPFRGPGRPILLKKRLTGNAVGITNDGEWAPLYMRQNGRGNFEVILDELGFDDVILGIKHLGEV